MKKYIQLKDIDFIRFKQIKSYRLKYFNYKKHQFYVTIWICNVGNGILGGYMSVRRREMFTTTLSKDLKEELKGYSDRTMIPMSKLVEKAITEYLTRGTTQSN